MSFLVFSIIFSVLVSVLLKISRKRSISIEVAIGVNYLVAILLTFLFLQPNLSAALSPISIVIIVALGLLLPSIFVVMGKSVLYAGIVKSDAAQRLSLIISMVAAFTILGEQANSQVLAGVGVAFVALGCLLHKPGLLFSVAKGDTSGGEVPSTTPWKTALLLLGVWAGYGTIDILFKQMSKQGNAFSATLIFSFIAAGIIMWIYLIVQFRMRKSNPDANTPLVPIKLTTPSIIGGIVLGCLNFGNIYFYVKAHQAMSQNPSVVFAGMNMGVISLGTIIGALCFKEKMSWVNALGILLALGAIALLYL